VLCSSLSLFSLGLQLFYGKKSGKGKEQNPKQQNDLRSKETKAEVIRKEEMCFPGRILLHRTGLKDFCY
jgi:hypothetical protein